MLQSESIIVIVDNSGAKDAKCIHVAPGYKIRYAVIGSNFKSVVNTIKVKGSRMVSALEAALSGTSLAANNQGEDVIFFTILMYLIFVVVCNHILVNEKMKLEETEQKNEMLNAIRSEEERVLASELRDKLYYEALDARLLLQDKQIMVLLLIVAYCLCLLYVVEDPLGVLRKKLKGFLKWANPLSRRWFF